MLSHLPQDESQAASHAKIVQTELAVGFLFKERSKTSGQERLLWISGPVPTCLQAVDHLNGETTRACVWQAISSIAEIQRIWSDFPLRVRVSCTDKAGANFRCESGLQEPEFMQGFTSIHTACDVHRLSTCIGNANLLVASDVSGLLNCGLVCNEVSSTKRLRDHLRFILETDLVIDPSMPSQHAEEIRIEVYDMYLPTSGVTPAYRNMNQKRRTILAQFLNGDLHSESITHHCPFYCCGSREVTLAYMVTFVTWALVPYRLPVYSRKSWIGQNYSLDWVGLLEAHHGLFTRLMNLYVGKAQCPPTTSAMSREHGDGTGWDFALLDEVADVQDLQDAVPEGANGPTTEQSNKKDPPDRYDEENAQRRFDLSAWVRSKPYAKLCVMKELAGILLGLMGHFLVLSSKRFEKKQAAQAASGRARTYVAVLAQEGSDVSGTFDSLLKCLHTDISAAVHPGDVNAGLKTLRFCMVSSAMCSMHKLLRLPRSQFPYALFKLLQAGENLEQVAHDLVQTPSCLHDDFFKLLIEHYHDANGLCSPECLCIVECIAKMFPVDIACLEARHSTNRDFSLLRSKGWVSSLEALSARFNIQHFSVSESTLNLSGLQPQDAESFPVKHEHASQTRTRKKTQKQHTKKKGSRGGGGGWRAFVSVTTRGQKSKPDLSALGQQFRELSAQEREKFRRIGSAGTRAHRHGFAAFGARKRKKTGKMFTEVQKMIRSTVAPRPLPGDMSASGALVAQDIDAQLVQSVSSVGSVGAFGDLAVSTSFCEKYGELLDSMPSVKEQDHLRLTDEENAALTRHAEQIKSDPLSLGLLSSKHTVAAGQLEMGSSALNFSAVHWQPPTPAAVPASPPPIAALWSGPGPGLLLMLYLLLFVCLFVCLFGWLVGWLFGWLVVWLFGCLVLDGCVFVCLFV
eukprot:Skav201936  [mRNA]  locus=scaffold1356:67969:71672:+ [translate_table: standard]